MNVVLNCFACYKQFDWLKKVIAILIISLYIPDMGVTCNGISWDLPNRNISVKCERYDFIQIGIELSFLFLVQ